MTSARPFLAVLILLLLVACTPSRAQAEQRALEEFRVQNARVAGLLAGKVDPAKDPLLAAKLDRLRMEVEEKNLQASVLRSERKDGYWLVVITIPYEETVPEMEVLVYDDGHVEIPAVEEMLSLIGA